MVDVSAKPETAREAVARAVIKMRPATLSAVRRGNGTLGVEARVRTVDKTGVEMEALTAVTVAALTIYDMVKALEKGVTIARVELVEKSGGKSGYWKRSR